MKISTIIIGIILFALATMLIYVWGMYRQVNQSKDLMNLLFSKGQNILNKHLKKSGSITVKEAEKLLTGLSAKLPFTSQKSVVTDAKEFAERLLDYMERTGQVQREGNTYKKR